MHVRACGCADPSVKKVEMDLKAWKAAFADGVEIHRLLAADEELASGVNGWRHTGDPTTTFVNTLILLRSVKQTDRVSNRNNYRSVARETKGFPTDSYANYNQR